MSEEMKNGKVCNCHHHKVIPAAIILIGLSALLTNWNIITVATNNVVWPVLLIVIGFIKMKGKNCKCC